MLNGIDASASTAFKFRGIPYDTAKRMISIAIPKSPKDKINKILQIAKEKEFSNAEVDEFFDYMDKMLEADKIDQGFYNRKEASFDKAQDEF